MATTATDITSGAFQVRGLRAAAENLDALPGLVKMQIGRDALRAAGVVLEREALTRTYTTFHKLTGAIQSGMRVSIGAELRGDVLYGVIGEYPDAAAGVRTINLKRLMRAGKGSVTPLNNVAYWWRFLEFGTAPRRAARTPRSNSSPRVKRWLASSSRGAIAARSWVRPAFASKANEAADTFVATMHDGVEREVGNLPKQ